MVLMPPRKGFDPNQPRDPATGEWIKLLTTARPNTAASAERELKSVRAQIDALQDENIRAEKADSAEFRQKLRALGVNPYANYSDDTRRKADKLDREYQRTQSKRAREYEQKYNALVARLREAAKKVDELPTSRYQQHFARSGGEVEDGALWRTNYGSLPGLSQREREETVHTWFSGEYYPTEEYLRHGWSPPKFNQFEFTTMYPEDAQSIQARVDMLKAMIDRSKPFYKPAVVSRFVDTTGFLPETGRIFTDESFVSTTASRGMSGYGKKELRIHIPAGARALRGRPEFYENGAGEAQHYEEYLLPPGTRFRVMGRDRDGADLEVLL
jgi:hypothetical protein